MRSLVRRLLSVCLESIRAAIFAGVVGAGLLPGCRSKDNASAACQLHCTLVRICRRLIDVGTPFGHAKSSRGRWSTTGEST